MCSCVLPLSELSESKHPWQLLIGILSEPSLIRKVRNAYSITRSINCSILASSPFSKA